jgi:hypothetical protein
VVAPHHPNERQNFLDKIERECLKLNRASKSAPGEVYIALVRLDEVAPFDLYVQWAAEYIERPTVSLGGVVLYQSAVAINLKEDTTSLHHHMRAIFREGAARRLNLTIPVGVVSQQATSMEMVFGATRIPLGESHLYQRQDIFLKAEGDLATGITANIHQVPGVTQHAVFELGAESMVLSSKQSCYGEVLLFT